jgi:Ulp1 family protease
VASESAQVFYLNDNLINREMKLLGRNHPDIGKIGICPTQLFANILSMHNSKVAPDFSGMRKWSIFKNFGNLSHVIIPMNLYDNEHKTGFQHWVLGCADLTSKEIRVLDSFWGSRKQAANLLVPFFNSFYASSDLPETPGFTVVEIDYTHHWDRSNEQTDRYSCGNYMLVYCGYLLQTTTTHEGIWKAFKNLRVTSQSIQAHREELRERIIQNSKDTGQWRALGLPDVEDTSLTTPSFSSQAVFVEGGVEEGGVEEGGVEEGEKRLTSNHKRSKRQHIPNSRYTAD